jgi:hypothetical protein
MIQDGTYDEIKESIMEALGWSATGLCLAVIKTLQEIDCWVFKWVNSDDPHDVLTHVHLYLNRHPEQVYAAMKSVLVQYDLEFEDWEWSAITTQAVPVHVPDECQWTAIISFRSKHTNWTANDPPPGGERLKDGWQYHPHPFPNALIHGIHRGNCK